MALSDEIKALYDEMYAMRLVLESIASAMGNYIPEPDAYSHVLDMQAALNNRIKAIRLQIDTLNQKIYMLNQALGLASSTASQNKESLEKEDVR